MLRRAGAWVLLAALGVVLGLSVAWLQDTLGIPRYVVSWFWIVVMAAALCFAGWTAWGYYRAVRDEDDEE